MADRSELFWRTPKELAADKVRNMVTAWNEDGPYAAEYTQDGDDARIVLRRKGNVRYFEPVTLADRASANQRWLPLQAALKASRAYRDNQGRPEKANARAQELRDLNPTGDPLKLERWLECIGWAIGMSPRESIAAMASWMEDEFTKRFGKNYAFVYARTYAGMAAFQIAEVLPRFAVLPAQVVADAIHSGRASFMAEEAYSHTATNFFGIPLGIAYPKWMGTVVCSVTNAVAFVLEKPIALPYPHLDAQHRDIWKGWTPAWYERDEKGWEALEPARTGAFFAWYVDRLNALLDRLMGFESTASTVTGEIRPLKQIALIRSVFQLQDLVARMLITSDPYARGTWAMLALARFDDLGWGFDLITDPGRMTDLMAALEEDPEIGGLFGTYGLRVWRSVMGGLVAGAAGEPIKDNTKIRLLSGKVVETSAYARDYLRAVRDTIHRFGADAMKDEFALHAGILPLNLSQLVALLWLRALVDPEPLIKPFRM